MRSSGRRVGALLVAVGATTLVSSSAAAPGPRTRSSLEAQPITAVILVDESGSLSRAAIASERDAATSLVASDLSSNSRFMIAGFGSANRRGQSAVRPYCNFIRSSDRVAREELAACARRVHVRTAKEGNDTDHARAIQFALDRLQSQSRGVPVIFLLTDGVLDVSNSKEYGRDTARRTPEALRRIKQIFLPEARRRRVQIWPLGFGSAVSKAGLQLFAEGGAGTSSRCSTVAAARPRAVVVRDTADVVYSLVQALGRSRCGAVTTREGGVLNRGKSVDLRVAIPEIATDGALTVVKSDPSFRVDFFDPRGNAAPSVGTVERQQFQRSGESGRVEALQIRNPITGIWRVRVSDPRKRARGTRVSAFAVWEGALQASLLTTPAQPRPGQTVGVDVRVLSRNGVVRARGLRGVKATAEVAGGFGSLPIVLRRGRTEDAFRGRFRLPSDAKGDFDVIARVARAGVSADERVQSFTIQARDFVTAVFDVRIPARIYPGSRIAGTIITTNEGPRRRGGVRLVDVPPNQRLTISSPLRVIPSGRAQFPFTLTVPKSAPVGPLFGTVEVFGKNGVRLNATVIDSRVSEKPTWPPTWLVALLGALVLVAAFIVLLLYRKRRAARFREMETGDLRATLRKANVDLGSLDAPGGPV